MDNHAQNILARSGVATVLLIGSPACAPKHVEPTEDLPAAEVDAPAEQADQAGAAAGASSDVTADFDGDGYDDLAIGVPGEGLGSDLPSVGAVNVLYGLGGGLSAAGDQIWHQNSVGVLGGAEAGDRFGHALATGDFNGDGYADLAIGTPFEDIGAINNAGAVNVLYGSASGLTAVGDQLWHQNSPGILGAAEQNDMFGSSLSSGDFDGDGYDDLAVGVPSEDIMGRMDAGMVNIIYGSETGLTAVGDQIWHQDIPGINGAVEAGDRFGSALAAGDFDNDGRDDLAVGVPHESVGLLFNAGMVNLIYGSKVGLSMVGDQAWHQDSFGILGKAEANDEFGRALTVGDFDGDGYADLAVGVPLEDVGVTSDAGAVNTIYGTAAGLTLFGDQLWHQDSPGILGTAESSDHFGWALAAGDFNDDGRDDLAVGVPHEDLGAATVLVDAGAVNLIYGSELGLSALADQLWQQDSVDVPGVAEEFDAFGSSLTVGDFDANGPMDLVIGVPAEDVGAQVAAGAVNLVYGAVNGLTSVGSQIWHQNVPGVLGSSEAGDQFGFSVR